MSFSDASGRRRYSFSPSSVLKTAGLNMGMAFVAVFFFSLLFNLLMLTIPLYLVQLYTRILTSESLETLLVLSLAAVFALFFASLFDLVRQSILQKLSQRLYIVLGEKVIAASLDSSLSVPDRTVPMQDVDMIRRFIGGRDITNFMDVPFSILFLALLFAIHPIIGGIATGIAVLVFLLALFNDFASSAAQRLVVANMRQSADQLGLFAAQVPLLSGMGMPPAVVNRWLEAQAGTAAAMQRSEGTVVVVQGISKWLRSCLQIIVLAVAAYLVLDGDLNPGMLIASSVLATRAVSPIEGLISGQREFRRALDGYFRIARLLSDVPPKTRLRHEPQSGRVDVSGLVATSAGGGQLPVLKGVTFALKEGEIVAVVGPSGAGKSVLGQCLVGAIEPGVGSVKVDGTDLKSCDRAARGSVFGYLPQRPDVMPGTISENIARFGPLNHDLVLKAVRLCGLDSELGRLPERLDTPMRRAAFELAPGTYKRLLLARAFYGSPRLIVLDEPGADLDLEGEQSLARALEEHRRMGATIVLISPRGSLHSLADRTIILKNGVIESIQQRSDFARVRPAGVQGSIRLLGE